MNVLIAGSTGVLGRAVIPPLIAEGHKVTALVRSPEKEADARKWGAEPVYGDILDGDSLTAAADGAYAVLHLATVIPRDYRDADKWKLNDLVRTKGTKNLIRASVRAGVELYLQQSTVFPYGDHGGEWINEETPFPAIQPSRLESTVAMEDLVKAQDRLPWVILRGGAFYGPEPEWPRGCWIWPSKGC